MPRGAVRGRPPGARGGRPKGSRNKRTLETIEKIETSGLSLKLLILRRPRSRKIMRCFSDIGRIVRRGRSKGRPRVMDEDDLVLIRRSFDEPWPTSRRFTTPFYDRL